MKNQRKIPKLRQWLSQISVPIYLLVILFAMSSWIDINSVLVELPLFVNKLPEGWSLPSYLVFIIQIGNIAPLCFVIAVKLCPQKVKEWPFAILIIITGASACLSLAFFWDKTSMIGDKEYSTGLLCLVFILAISDCTSSVVYLPYMAQFKEQYITAFYIGGGLSGLVPGLVGLIQGLGGDPICVNKTTVLTNESTGMNVTHWIVEAEYKEPLFSVKVFFFFLFIMMLVSCTAFLTLHLAPFSKRERLHNTDYKSKVQQKYILNHDHDNKPDKNPLHNINNKTEKTATKDQRKDETASDMTDDASDNGTGVNVHSKSHMTRFEFIFFLVLIGWLNALSNAILPSIQSYAALPYGSMAYTLLVRLSSIVNPLAAFFALFYSTKSKRCEVLVVITATILVGYQFALALCSPEPPLQHTAIGSILVVTSGVLAVLLLVYSKVTIAAMLKSSKGRLGLLWCGAITQAGSFLGAIITFVLVNTVKLFTGVSQCE